MTSQNLPDFLPERITWLRALVASIPTVGGALDHLLFDKADAIRLRNIETALNALSEQLGSFQQGKIDKNWFSSEEALAAFKLMADSISYEPNRNKVEDMGRLVAACGEQQHSADDKKISVLEHISRLSHVQIKLLAVIANTAPQKKTLSSGGLEQSTTAIWLDDIVASLRSGPRFWIGTLTVDEELEVLESYNTIRRIPLMFSSERGYELTGIGRHAASYVDTAGL